MAHERSFQFPFFTPKIPEKRSFSTQSILGSPERARYQLYIRQFELPPSVEASLSEHESETLKPLIRAARRTASLYAFQEGKDIRANFYPPGVSKGDIDRAAQINPDIRSPYTIVSRSADGSLISYPIHEVFQEKIQELDIPKLLKDAANEATKARDLHFAIYLRARAKALETGDFKTSEKFWLERDNEPKIDIVIGPYDTYTDGFLGIKFAWESWVGVLDESSTQNSQKFLDSFLVWWKQESKQEIPRVKMRIDHTVIQSGQAAKYDWTGNSLPCQPEWREEFGSKFTIFKPVLEDKLRSTRLPAYRSIIDPNKRMGITDNLVWDASLKRIIGHEISHSLGMSHDIQSRLKQHASWVKELYCDLLALRGFAEIPELNPDPRLDMRERELSLALSFVEGLFEYIDYQRQRERPEYYVARCIILNYCLKNGTVQIENGRLTWDSPQQIFKDILILFSEVQSLQVEGKISNAEEFLARRFEPEICRPLVETLNQDQVPGFLRRP